MNLQNLRKPQKYNRRQAQCFTQLADYDFKLFHQPGSLNKVDDFLLQGPDSEKGGENNNSDVVLLKHKLFWQISMFANEGEILEKTWQQRTQLDNIVKLVLQAKDLKYKDTNGNWVRQTSLHSKGPDPFVNEPLPHIMTPQLQDIQDNTKPPSLSFKTTGGHHCQDTSHDTAQPVKPVSGQTLDTDL